MKTTIKHDNDECLVIPLKHVSGLMVIVNRTGTPKLWSKIHETTIKCKYFNFLVIPLKHLFRPGIRKLCPIAHENSHKNTKTASFSS